MTNGGTPPPGGQYPPPQGGGYPPPQGGYQGGYGNQPMSPQGRPLASWGKRVLAGLLDGLAIGIPATILMLVLGFGAFASSGLEECEQNAEQLSDACAQGIGEFIGKLLLTWLVITLLGLAYQTYFNGSERGQTLGKMALNIQVRDENTGGPIGYGKSFLRTLVAYALGFLCGMGQLLDVLWPLWDSKRQTLHDKAANSLVIDLQP